MSKSALLLPALVLVIAVAAPVFAGEIHRAVEAGDAEKVAELLAQNRSLITQQDDNHLQDHPLHTAAMNGRVEIARMLLDAGAPIDAGDSDDSTPLDDAGITGNREVAILLIDRGANVNHHDNNGGCPLSFATSGGDEEIVNRLLAAGARTDWTSNDRTTLLHFAAARNMTGFAGRLLASGADVNAVREDGKTPLHWAGYSRSGTDVARTIIGRGANVSVADNTGETPLHVAAQRGNLELARLLLGNGADPDPVDEHHWTPLKWAGRGDNVHLMTLLIAHGADVNRQDSEGRTALYLAVENGNVAMVDGLLRAGARVDLRESHEGRNPLHQAALKGFTDVVERLLNRGAYLESRDNSNMTPLAYAAQYGHDNIARLLKERGASPSSAPTDCPVDFASIPAPPPGEADIWFLEHSAWAVRTANHFLIFDYFERGRKADTPRLCNGCIDPTELRNENVTVFATHDHGDHYDPAIFDWRDKIRNVNYVLGCEPQDVPPYEFIGPRQSRTIKGMRVSTIESNDSGVGFLVEVDGLVLFHAGDHANRQRDFSGPYKAEIDYLAQRGVKPDVAFMPVSGCGFGDQEAVAMGVEYALDKLHPFTFIPMHAGSNCYRLKEFVAEREEDYPGTRMQTPDNVGDRIRFSKKNAS